MVFCVVCACSRCYFDDDEEGQTDAMKEDEEYAVNPLILVNLKLRSGRAASIGLFTGFTSVQKRERLLVSAEPIKGTRFGGKQSKLNRLLE